MIDIVTSEGIFFYSDTQLCLVLCKCTWGIQTFNTAHGLVCLSSAFQTSCDLAHCSKQLRLSDCLTVQARWDSAEFLRTAGISTEIILATNKKKLERSN